MPCCDIFQNPCFSFFISPWDQLAFQKILFIFFTAFEHRRNGKTSLARISRFAFLALTLAKWTCFSFFYLLFSHHPMLLALGSHQFIFSFSLPSGLHIVSLITFHFSFGRTPPAARAHGMMRSSWVPRNADPYILRHVLASAPATA